jgi:uncharacterized protein YkwD
MSRLVVLAVAFIAASALAADITPASVVAEMNVRRAAFGLPPLSEDSRLDQAAGDRVGEMEDEGYWGHVSPEGKEPFEWLRPRGYDYRYAGENLALGFDTVEVLVDAWMESKGHRANILSPVYHDCGVAVIEGSTTGRASGKSVVVMFGRDRNEVARAIAPASTGPLREPTPAARRRGSSPS